MPNLRIAALSFFCIVTAARSQALRGGEVVIADSHQAVHAVAADGSVRTLAQGAPLTSPSGVAVTIAGEVLVADFAGAIFVVPASGSIRPLVTGLSGPGGIAIDHDGTYLVTERTGPSSCRPERCWGRASSFRVSCSIPVPRLVSSC